MSARAPNPEPHTETLTDDELAALLHTLDNPDPIVTAGLAGDLYDPDYAGPGDPTVREATHG